MMRVNAATRLRTYVEEVRYKEAQIGRLLCALCTPRIGQICPCSTCTHSVPCSRRVGESIIKRLGVACDRRPLLHC